MDLAESRRIMAGGAGLRGRADFGLLARVAAALGASMGATRVVADLGWVVHERYIGTTGGGRRPGPVRGAGHLGRDPARHGLGSPRHVVAVNTDPSCPMMAMADLALVTDAPGLLEALAQRLGVELEAQADQPERPLLDQSAPEHAGLREASHG